MQKIEINENYYLTLSQKECGFEEVINNFKTAKEIVITTYNISKSDRELLNLLNNIPGEVNVTFITNIPGYEYLKDKEQIKNYLKILSARNFKCIYSSFISFDNHSKIIYTDKCAYIGSANYSFKNNKNIECGIIVKDYSVLKQIREIFIKNILTHSIPFDDNIILQNIIILGKTLENMIFEIEEKIYSYDDIPMKTIRYIDEYNLDFSVEDIESIQNIIEEINDNIHRLKDDYTDFLFDRKLISKSLDKLSYVINTDHNLYRLASFNYESLQQKYIDDNSIEDNTDKLVNDASDYADNELLDITYSIKEDFDDLFESIKSISIVLENLAMNFGIFIKSQSLDDKINEIGV